MVGVMKCRRDRRASRDPKQAITSSKSARRTHEKSPWPATRSDKPFLGIDPTPVVEIQRLTNPGIDVLNRPHPRDIPPYRPFLHHLSGPQTVHGLRTRQDSLDYMPTQDLLDRVSAPVLYPPGGSGRAARCSRTSAALIRYLRIEDFSHDEGRCINGLRFGLSHERAPRPCVAHV